MADSFEVYDLKILRASNDDLEDILHINRTAFGQEDEAELVRNLVTDPSAQPVLSLLARYKERAVGHILYTKAILSAHPGISSYLLAPMSVLPEFQGKGIGGRLIQVGNQILERMGVQLVFVLGHPNYYPKHGFVNDAGKHGFVAPYPILKKNADAWMYQQISKDALNEIKGKVMCCQALNKPEYWRE